MSTINGVLSLYSFFFFSPAYFSPRRGYCRFLKFYLGFQVITSTNLCKRLQRWVINRLFSRSKISLIPQIIILIYQAKHKLSFAECFPIKNWMKKTFILPHSALSWNFSPAENLANLSLQDGATKWHYCHQDPTSQPASQPPSHPASHHPILAFQIKTYISAMTEPIILKFLT